MIPPLLVRLVRQDLLERYAGSTLGSAWLLINPITQILIFTTVFSGLFAPRLPGNASVYDYGTYLVSGIMPWAAFANTVVRTAGVFIERRAILTKVPVGLPTIAVHIAISEGIVLSAILMVVVAMQLAFGGLTPNVLYLPLLVAQQQLLGFCIGAAGAVLTVFIRDTKDALAVVLQIWFWLTPIVYVLSVLPAPVQALQSFNPANWFIDGYHRALVFGAPPSYGLMILSLCAGAVGSWIALRVIRRLERDIRDFL